MEMNERKKLEENPIICEILRYKRQGISDTTIAKISDFPWKQQRISKNVKKCIEVGLITKAEIDEARKERQKIEKNSNLDRKRVLEGLRAGETDKTISGETTVGEEQVRIIRKSLVQEGLITEEEIEEAKKRKAEENQKNKNEEKYIASEEEVLYYLMLGYDNYEVRREIPNLDTTQYTEKINKLIKDKKITKAVIKEKREERQRKIKEDIFEALKKGKSIRFISTSIGYSFDRDRVKTYIKKIKEENNITDEDILQWRNEQEDSLGNKKKYVLYGLEQGWTNAEIGKKYSKQGLDEKSVIYYKKMLLTENGITEEAILEYSRLRKERDAKQNLDISEFDREVLSYLEKGYENNEIASLTGKDSSYIKLRVDWIKEKGKITGKQIKQLRIQRKREEKIEKMNKLKEQIDFELESNEICDKEMVIREYINVCFEIYKKQKIEKSELRFLKQAIQMIPVKYKDIYEFAKICKEAKAYKEILETFRSENAICKEKNTRISQKKSKELEEIINQAKVAVTTVRIKELKREIDLNVRFNKEPSKEKKEAIREYIELCYEKYAKEKIENTELEFLRQAIPKITVNDTYILGYTRVCINAEQYKEALNMIRSANEMKKGKNETTNKNVLQKLENMLEKVCRVQEAIQIMKKGNTNIAVVSSITGLSKDEVGILKIKLQRKPIRILNMVQRKQILELLALDKDATKIQEKVEITDFEMEDIKEQALEYRRYKAKCMATKKEEREELDKQIEQNIRLRIVVLYTKLGRKPDYIAKRLKIEPETVQKDIKIALKQGGLIKQEELNGINPLACYKNLINEQKVL